MSYTLDSNVLIGLSRKYPRDIFPGLWQSVEESVECRDTCICEAVLHEIERGGDELPEWAKSLPNFVCKATDLELDTVKQIAIRHPGWVQGQKNEADPFVIAHAKADDLVIVTEEKRKGRNC